MSDTQQTYEITLSCEWCFLAEGWARVAAPGLPADKWCACCGEEPATEVVRVPFTGYRQPKALLYPVTRLRELWWIVSDPRGRRPQFFLAI